MLYIDCPSKEWGGGQLTASEYLNFVPLKHTYINSTSMFFIDFAP